MRQIFIVCTELYCNYVLCSSRTSHARCFLDVYAITKGLKTAGNCAIVMHVIAVGSMHQGHEVFGEESIEVPAL